MASGTDRQEDASKLLLLRLNYYYYCHYRGCLSLPRSQLGCTALYSLPFLPPLILVCPQQFEQFEQFELLLPSLPCRVLHPMPAVMVQPGHVLQDFFLRQASRLSIDPCVCFVLKS